MGGFGSGRDRYADTATVVESLSVDVADLKEYLEFGETTLTWRWGDADDPRARIKLATTGEAVVDDVDADESTAADRLQEHGAGAPARWVEFVYTATPAGATESVDVEDKVRVAYTAPPMGGLRPWFKCPGCGERREALHLPPWDDRPGESALRFRCRECHELGYETSRASGTKMKEAEVRYRRAFARADAEGRRPHPNQTPHTPERPSGRHESTHAELVEDVEQARAEWSASYHRGLARYSPGDEHEEFAEADAEQFLES
ncbi:hypothetical protein [Halorubrum tropicale]|uniref:Uncharacterized protein n=1 Tax=Halorubrum tropicale TaxID=1765655 RepID=A0A0M9AHK7_9EURY|nr:hypothetical protein [Halorubrum tropicale]KOX92139.1 hypothetical protein AMR74_16980 [Halorubrum tropicale]